MKGAFTIFRLAGMRVYLHFTWFIVAALEIVRFAGRYRNPLWATLEYLALFAIVLAHEFGHALACRQIGGQADTIVLWPLGGIAFVRPPPRPGAYLWSIAAGPLVNVVLLPVFTFLVFAVAGLHWKNLHPDLYNFVFTVFFMNGFLLFFNLIPVYPLDGGQIVRGLLWLKVGPIRSLKVASILGFAGAILFALWAISSRSIWLGILAFFIFAQAQVVGVRRRIWRSNQKRWQITMLHFLRYPKTATPNTKLFLPVIFDKIGEFRNKSSFQFGSKLNFVLCLHNFGSTRRRQTIFRVVP